MQFIEKTGIAVFVLLVLGTVGLGFGSGFLAGRKFPAHRYERFGESWCVLDSTTGKVCNPLKDPNANPTDLSDLFPPNKPATDANGFQIVKPTPDYPPPCGK
jgi:hypothetical protein